MSEQSQVTQQSRLEREHERLKADSVRAVASFINWANYGTEFVGEQVGEDAVRAYFDYIGRKFGEDLYAGGPEAILKGLDWFHQMEGSDVRYEEDNGGIRTVVTSCNTGGRMKRDGIINRRWSKGMYVGLPWYCSHCPQWWAEVPREKGMAGFYFVYGNDPVRGLDRPCVYGYHKGGLPASAPVLEGTPPRPNEG